MSTTARTALLASQEEDLLLQTAASSGTGIGPGDTARAGERRCLGER